MEWLELSLAGQAVASPPRSREAPRSGGHGAAGAGKCGPGPGRCRGAPHRRRPCLLPGSSLVLLEFLCEAGASGGMSQGSSPSWAGK